MLRPRRPAAVLASAGVGATPVLAMLHALVEARSSRPIWWLHGARSRADHSFAAEVVTSSPRCPNAHRVVCYSHPGPETEPASTSTRRAGHRPRARRAGVPTDGDFYLCGPTPFMHDLGAALATQASRRTGSTRRSSGRTDSITPGIARHEHADRTRPRGRPAPGPADLFSRSNLTVGWDPAFLSLLELAEACDVPVRWSCRSGVCHTCETGVVTDRWTTGPIRSNRPPREYILICCSQPQTDMVLDL